ncbi:hypothetical protein AB0C06_29365 [Micromonospora inaquosa]|uniref:hypothetical protein n=1 Tax=Micromonospora inaquosa TaxID=2203716 RepID=UPI0033FDE091
MRLQPEALLWTNSSEACDGDRLEVERLWTRSRRRVPGRQFDGISTQNGGKLLIPDVGGEHKIYEVVGDVVLGQPVENLVK